MKDKNIKDPIYILIQDEIDRIDGKENKNKGLYYGFRLAQIIITGVITVLGSKTIVSEPGAWIVSLGALVTILTTTETLFLFGVKKDTYTKLLFELREIRAQIIFLAYSSETKIEDFRLSKEERKIIFDRYKDASVIIAELYENKKNNPATPARP